MPRYGDLDYARLTKAGFLLGLASLLVGVGGEWAIHATAASLPPWVATLFFDLEVVGVLFALFVPILFSVVMPLTE